MAGPFEIRYFTSGVISNISLEVTAVPTSLKAKIKGQKDKGSKLE